MALPDHLTPAELASLLRVPEADIQQRIDEGHLRIEEAGIPRAEAQGLLLLEAMLPLRVEYREGSGSADQLLPERICKDCGQRGGVRYTGSDVLEGDLELFHLIHTEVEHHLSCGRCGARWTIFKML